VGRDSSVGIATCYGLDGPGIESLWGARFSAPVQTVPGAHWVSFSGVKRPGRGAETHLVKVKESRNRSGVAQRVPGGLGSQISITIGT
jgi:hypothetical protein